MSDSQGLNLAVSLGSTNTVALFTAFCPRLSDIRRASTDDVEFVADLRHGECVAVGFALLTGLAGSALTNSAAPLVVTSALAAGMVLVYEYSLSHRPLSPTPKAVNT